jgi:hypothetical protein
MAVGRARTCALAVSMFFVSFDLSCSRYYEHSLHVPTVAKIDERKLSPEKRRSALLGCVTTNALYVNADFTNEISQGEPVRMGHHAAGCYTAYVHDVGKDKSIPAAERAAIALTAEKSVLAIDPDPEWRLKRAAQISEIAAAALKEANDPGAVDASLRASWYASRADADEVTGSAKKLWAEVREADGVYIAARRAQEAARNAALTQAVSSMRTAMVANANLSPQQRQQLEQQEQLQRTITNAAIAIAHVSQKLAESRADLRVLLDSGTNALRDMMPELEKHVSSVKDFAAASEVVLALDGVRRNEPGANERLFVRIAKSFGAEVKLPAHSAEPRDGP